METWSHRLNNVIILENSFDPIFKGKKLIQIPIGLTLTHTNYRVTQQFCIHIKDIIKRYVSLSEKHFMKVIVQILEGYFM